MPSDTTDDPTTLGSESGRVALLRRRDERTDHVHEISFGERVEVTCPDCGESTTVGIYGNVTDQSHTSCWAWDCDAYHKFERDRDAETDANEQSDEIVQTKLVTDGGTCHEPTPSEDADLPRTNAGTPLPELRFVDRFATSDDVFYAVTEENGTRLYRVTGETTIARSLLAYDAVIHETAGYGCVTTASYNEKYETIDLYHHMGGREASFRADRILDEPVITLAEVDRV